MIRTEAKLIFLLLISTTQIGCQYFQACEINSYQTKYRANAYNVQNVYDKERNLLSTSLKNSSGENQVDKYIHTNNQISQSGSAYYLDNEKRITSFQRKNNVHLYEYNYSYNRKGQLSLSTRKRFIIHQIYGTKLFVTEKYEYKYSDEKLVNIIMNNIMADGYELLGFGENWTEKYDIEYVKEKYDEDITNSIYNIILRELPGFPVKLSKNSSGRMPSYLLKSIHLTRSNEPSEHTKFDYTHDKSGKISKIDIRTPIPPENSDTIYTAFVLNYTCK